jgi:hypothetical protein
MEKKRGTSVSQPGEQRKCPSGSSEKVIPTIYGLPGEELLNRSMKDEVCLGGVALSRTNHNGLVLIADLSGKTSAAKPHHLRIDANRSSSGFGVET